MQEFKTCPRPSPEDAREAAAGRGRGPRLRGGGRRIGESRAGPVRTKSGILVTSSRFEILHQVAQLERQSLQNRRIGHHPRRGRGVKPGEIERGWAVGIRAAHILGGLAPSIGVEQDDREREEAAERMLIDNGVTRKNSDNNRRQNL